MTQTRDRSVWVGQRHEGGPDGVERKMVRGMV